MVKVKICGITNLEDAQAAVRFGASAVGFLFFKESRRYVSPRKARDIISCLPKDILKVGVFVNGKEKDIHWAADFCKLDILQFHGDESPKFCERFSNYKVIKALRLKRKRDLKAALRYNNSVFAFLFDAYTKVGRGGTGEQFDWELLTDREEEGITLPVFLAGGLTDKNVSEAIEIARPDWVDVSSSVEARPGKKDSDKVEKFIKAVRKKDAAG